MVEKIHEALQNVPIDLGRLFQRIGLVWSKKRLDILREDVEKRSNGRWREERVKPQGFSYEFCEVLC